MTAVIVGMCLAIGSAFVSNLGFLWRHRGAVEAPDVDVRRPIKTVVGLFSAKWWTIGFGAAIAAWLLHVASLSLAPLSLVQALLAGGFVFLAVLADRFFGFTLGRREWAGLILTAVGIAFLAVTAGDAEGESANYKLAAMIAFEGGLVLAGAALIAAPRSKRASKTGRGILLGAAAGLLFTVTHVAIKALTGAASGGVTELLQPGLGLVIAGGVAAFFASARSLQLGEAVPVIAVTNIAGNLSAIVAGVVVFGDKVGDDFIIVALRLCAFVLVIVAGALIPGPLKAAKKTRAKGEREAGQPAPAT
jgi:drug/metabolite transporter (DMT)-like permease